MGAHAFVLTLAMAFAIGDLHLPQNAREESVGEVDDASREAICEGDQLYAKMRYREAIEAYSRALESRPIAQVYVRRAVSWAALDDYQKAIADCGRALDVTPRDDEKQLALIYAWLARFEIEQGNYSRALDALTLSIDLGWESPEAFVIRSDLHRRRGEYQQAIDDISRAIELNPNDIRGNLVRRAKMWIELGEFERGAADANLAIIAHGEDGESLKARAICFLFGGHVVEAVADIERLVELDPQETKYRILLAIALTHDDIDATADSLGRAISLAEGACEETGWQDARQIQIYAKVLSCAGRWEEAIVQQEIALSLAPDEFKQHFGKTLWLLQRHECLAGDLSDIHVSW